MIDDRERSDVKQPVLLRNLSQSEDAPIWQIVNIYAASAAFHSLIFNQTIAAMAAALSGARALRIWHDQIQYKPNTYGGRLHWHQDSPLWPPLQPKDAQITAWIALDDADMDNGCMYMVPGSYRWGNRRDALHDLPDGKPLPESIDGEPIYVAMCPVKKGHVHFHHPLTWHGSGANTSKRPRRAIALHFMTEATHYDAAGGEHPMKAFISVADGENLVGDAFPLIWSAAESSSENEICAEEEPTLQQVEAQRFASCHFADSLDLQGIHNTVGAAA